MALALGRPKGRTDLIQRNRTITLVVALATLTSNILSSVLFHQLPDDPYHLGRNFGWYLHFANVLSVFGLIGALRVCFPAHSFLLFGGGRAWIGTHDLRCWDKL